MSCVGVEEPFEPRLDFEVQSLRSSLMVPSVLRLLWAQNEDQKRCRNDSRGLGSITIYTMLQLEADKCHRSKCDSIPDASTFIRSLEVRQSRLDWWITTLGLIDSQYARVWPDDLLKSPPGRSQRRSCPHQDQPVPAFCLCSKQAPDFDRNFACIFQLRHKLALHYVDPLSLRAAESIENRA